MYDIDKKMLVVLKVIRLLYIMRDVINAYLSGELDRYGAVDRLWDSIDGSDLGIIYSLPPSILNDCFHSLRHLTESGYETTDFEMIYFRDCLNKSRVYNLDEKMELTRKYFESL